MVLLIYNKVNMRTWNNLNYQAMSCVQDGVTQIRLYLDAQSHLSNCLNNVKLLLNLVRQNCRFLNNQNNATFDLDATTKVIV